MNTIISSVAPAPDVFQLPATADGDSSVQSFAQFKANVLLVDDRPDKLLALEAVLEGLGQNIVKATSGKEALRCLLKQDFAVILLDVSMPGMDGFETASLIRARLRSERTPIIFVTSFGDTRMHVTRGYSLGAVDYLLTPIVPEVLRTKVSVFVDLYRQTELTKRQAERLRLLEEQRHQRELAQVTDRLEEETKRNRFFTLAIDLLGIANLDGRFRQANPAWEKVLGYRESELCSSSMPDLVHAEDRAAVLGKMERLRQDSEPARFEARFLHQDGSCRWLSCTMVPFQTEKLLYMFAQDISIRKSDAEEIHRLNRILEGQVAALTAANSELESVNYSIAHDLRTPLRSMGGFGKALLEDENGRLSPEGVEFVKRIVRSTKYMDALLQDLLAYSSLNRTQMPPEPVSIETVVKETLALYEDSIRERHAQVEVRSPLGSVLAHLPTMRQIIGNLLDNGLKFCPPDRSPCLQIYTIEKPGTLRLWVEDNGIGISPEHHERIFGLFRQLHHSDTRPGTGIGLAIVRRAAERMGGKAGVESSPGKGSRFWVDLPVSPEEAT
jgi:PAS domain S-box-containing protein